jgi:hypothetical protein
MICCVYILSELSLTADEKKNSDTDSKDFFPSSIPKCDASYNGVIMPLSKPSLATHVLIIKFDETFAVLCYLRSEKLKLNLWENHKVHVSGKEQWVRGFEKPLLTVEDISQAGNLSINIQ